MKDSIKREQSQAGLSFAERKNQRSLAGGESNFRPKVKRNRLLLLLALLLTAATGAWADNTVTWEGATLKSVNVASYESNKTQTIGDITVTANSGYFKDFGSGNDGVIASAYETNGLVFSANAKFKSVEVTASSESTFNHTSGSATSHTYTVNPTATSFALPYGDGWINITKIVFTFEDAAAEPAGYTVSMKSDVKDADKWTVKVGEGEAQALPIGGLKGDGSETVTLQYNGRLKVKGVKATSDAAPAKTPATVTTAPTGAAVVGVGKTTALVSGGAADGGTLMYAVTTTNTKPTSTDGFSDAVPTAQTITASGTVYVWYFVKGDDTHTDSEIAATAIEVTVKAFPITVTWNPSDIVPKSPSDKSFTKDGITFTAAMCDFQVLTFSGGGTFTNTIGNFTKIEISADYAGDVSGTGWSNDGWQSATWTGNAASVSFSGDIWGGGMTCEGGNLTIVFTIE